MSVETSEKILKVFGIIAIVIGALGVLVGVLSIVGGGLLGAGLGDMGGGPLIAAMAIVAGLVVVVRSIVTLLEGIFSVIASNNYSKIMPAFVFSIIALVLSGLSVINSIVQKGGLLFALISLAISCLVFVAANTIRKNG